MLKKLKWKFIAIAEGSISFVMIVVFLFINFAYSRITAGVVDSMLSALAKCNCDITRLDEVLESSDEYSKETPFEVRFFSVAVNDSNGIEVNLTNIASISEADAVYMFENVKKARKGSFGYLGKYRYHIAENGDSVIYIFMDASRQIATVNRLIMISVGVFLITILGTFGLVTFLSRYAIRSTLKNIEKQKQFITDVSHEIKTPLTIISSYADIMCMENEDNEWAHGILKESERMSRLVSDLTLLSRWDEENKNLQLSEFTLSNALWDIITPFLHIAEKQKKSISVNMDENISLVADEGALQTSFSTLMENALKYSTENSEIEVRLYTRKRNAVVDIINSCSIDSSVNLDRLFDRFYRADASRSRQYGGFGIGLSIVKAIIEAHNGEVSAFYIETDRICFRTVLPLQ